MEGYKKEKYQENFDKTSLNDNIVCLKGYSC